LLHRAVRCRQCSPALSYSPLSLSFSSITVCGRISDHFILFIHKNHKNTQIFQKQKHIHKVSYVLFDSFRKNLQKKEGVEGRDI
jgi:hypothetical protein